MLLDSWTDLSLNRDNTLLLVAEAQAQGKLPKSACPGKAPACPTSSSVFRRILVQKNFPSPL